MFEWYRRYLEKRAEEKSRLADKQLDALRFRYHSFKNLLITNNDLLEHLTRLEVHLQDRRRVYPGLRSNVEKLLKLTLDLVQNLNYLSEGSYTDLFAILRQISARLTALAREIDPCEKVPLIIPIDETHTDLVQVVGGKAAPLGILKNKLGLPVPDGFVITTEACQLFLEQNGLLLRIREMLRNLTPENLAEVEKTSREIQEMVLNARVPQELRDAMEKVCAELLNGATPIAPRGIAVRSSAILEDSEHSFAGQFATVLNVTTKEAFFKAYKKVLASSFNENSLMYRLHRHLGFHEIEMAVLCLAMVPARSAGTLYTVDPNDLESERMILCSLWGLGEYLANGRLPSDVFHVSRLDTKHYELTHLANKTLRLACDFEHGGTREETVPDEDLLKFSLEEEEILALCEDGLAIEKYMGVPQDIEWAITEDNKLHILQARTLHTRDSRRDPARRGLEEMKLLMERGTAASKGIGAGVTVFVRNEEDLARVEPGSILVSRESIFKITRMITGLGGIILERGNPLEHLASVAREHRIPMLVRATNAMDILEEGRLVTLDADEGRVYEGEPKSQRLARTESVVVQAKEQIPAAPGFDELRRLIFPLNLADVRDARLQMHSCKSVHDVIRFCHEQGIQTMFEINDGEYSRNRFYTSKLDVPIPFPMDIINLGGAFSVPGHPRKVSLKEITSTPFLAFWKGVSHEGIRWSGPPVKVNFKALGSVMSNTMLDAARSGQPLGSRTYALLSRDYMNLNARLAYHFAMVDTLCSQTTATNYINFRFKGGGTGLERRMLRVRFIARILEDLGFFVNLKQDLINATLRGLPSGEQEEKLDMMGRLLGCSRLLDMAMDNEEAMEWFVNAFQRGNYSFDPDA